MPDTEVLPATTAYVLRRDRCVVETSIRLLGLPLRRTRLTATGGHVDLAGRSLTLRTAELTFDGEIGEDHVVTGEPHLTGDLRHVDDERIILWVKGTVRAPRRIHVEIAAEFVR
ncbi:hypothetical protein GCM10027258_74510 [Amycolatopsis stemonae]